MWRENIVKALEDQGDRPVSQNNAFVVAIQMSDDLTLEQKQQEYDMVQAMLENLRPSDCITLIGYGGNENGFYAPLPHGITDIVRGDQEEAKEELLNEPTNHSTSIHWVFMTVENFCTHEFAGDAYNKQFVFVTNGNAGDLPSASYYSQVQGDKYNYDMSVVMLGNTDVSIMADCYIYTGGSGIQLSDTDVEPEDVITILYERLDYGDLWKDEDGDGIPDIIESFPILTSFGYFVTVDPTKWSTDSDLLSDGKELIKQVYAYNYIQKLFCYSLGPNDKDYQFFLQNECDLMSKIYYYLMTSDPTLADWDQDNANDDNDATPAKPNGPINYILYDRNDERLVEQKDAYEADFIKKGMEFQTLDLYNDRFFQCFFENLEYGFEEVEMDHNGETLYVFKPLTDAHYTRVDNIVVILHGSRGAIDPAQHDWIYAMEIPSDPAYIPISELLTNCSRIPIECIDYQTCFASYFYGDIKSVVIETLMATHAHSVYGSTGKLIFFCNKNQVICGEYSRYWLDSNNEIYYNGCYHSFDINERWDENVRPRYKVLNYPQ